MQNTQRFLFMITAHNVSPFLPKLVNSLAEQTHKNWTAVFVDDASTDDTLNVLDSLIHANGIADKFHVISNVERRYKAYNVYHALRQQGEDEHVVLMLDGDDWLATGDALQILCAEYERKWDVVWSNWRGSDGSPGTSNYLNPFIEPRRQPFLTSHLFTFKKRLFHAVTKNDLQDDDGQWFTAGCDVAIALPILDQTIKRKFIDRVLYVYNRDNPLNIDKCMPIHRKYVSEQQARTSRMLVRRQGKTITVDTEFLHANLYEFLQAATISSQLVVRREWTMALRSHLKKL